MSDHEKLYKEGDSPDRQVPYVSSEELQKTQNQKFLFHLPVAGELWHDLFGLLQSFLKSFLRLAGFPTPLGSASMFRVHNYIATSSYE